MTLTFPIDIQPNGRAKINNSSQAIKQFVQESLENVLATFGFDREFGSLLRSLDFTPNDLNYVEQRLFNTVAAALSSISEITFEGVNIFQTEGGVIKYNVEYTYQNVLEDIEFVLR
jgi:hypothetical protein